MAHLELSVVIPVYNNWWLTARCLRELQRLRDGSAIPFETIVVDNASTDETADAIGDFPWVRYLRHAENRNFAGGCNAGARAARAPLTFFLNSDAYPLGDAIAPLSRAFDRPEVAIAGGALFFEDGVTQAAGLVMLPNGHWHYFCRNLPSDLADVNAARDALGVSGAAMAVRTAWFLENGGFDERYVNGFEDVDLCLRARAQGHAIAYVADSRFAHYEAASENRFAREAENEQRFYAEWSPRLAMLPKTLRGEVGAVAIQHECSSESLLGAALQDLNAALAAFGHPIVRDRVRAWHRLDRRFRRSATLGWFGDTESPGVAIRRTNSAFPTIQSCGRVELSVPWLPCASPQRVAGLKVARADDVACRLVGIAGEAPGVSFEDLHVADFSAVPMTPEMLLGKRENRVACVVHLGLTDPSAFGNVLLAQAGIPAIVLERDDLRRLFMPDVAMITSEPREIRDCIAQVVADPSLRMRYGTRLAADARRRFSPRRSAIRVVDLLCAARFGLERPVA